ncbi:MAG: GNAT family N-acetyltransferase [Pseudomonadota bacterium]
MSAIALDRALDETTDRSNYIESISNKGGLRVAGLNSDVQAFCCLDRTYFFGRRFISLLSVSPSARRAGLGLGLLMDSARGEAEVWTSTNRSNTPMQTLLARAGWRCCGEVSGLDAGDPERFYRTP